MHDIPPVVIPSVAFKVRGGLAVEIEMMEREIKRIAQWEETGTCMGEDGGRLVDGRMLWIEYYWYTRSCDFEVDQSKALPRMRTFPFPQSSAKPHCRRADVRCIAIVF